MASGAEGAKRAQKLGLGAAVAAAALLLATAAASSLRRERPSDAEPPQAPAAAPSDWRPRPIEPEPVPPVVLRVVVDRESQAIDKDCWARLLKAPATPQPPEAKVQITVEGGKVTRAQASGVEPALSSCIESHVRGWSFPPEHVRSELSFSLHFSSSFGLIPDNEMKFAVESQRMVTQHECRWYATSKERSVRASHSVHFTVVNGKPDDLRILGEKGPLFDCIELHARYWQFPEGYDPTPGWVAISFTGH